MTQMTMAGRIPTAGPGHRGRWITLTVLCVTLLLVSLDNTILNVALPSIVGSMNATSTQLRQVHARHLQRHPLRARLTSEDLMSGRGPARTLSPVPSCGRRRPHPRHP